MKKRHLALLLAATLMVSSLMACSGGKTTETTAAPVTTAAPTEADLFLVDYHLPEKDGIEIVRMIRKKNFDVPIMILTVEEREYVMADAIEAGADDYALKPLTIQETAMVLEGVTIDQKPLKDHLEIIGHRDAFKYVESLVSEKQEFSEYVIKSIPSLILIDRAEDRGVYRRIPDRKNCL